MGVNERAECPCSTRDGGLYRTRCGCRWDMGGHEEFFFLLDKGQKSQAERFGVKMLVLWLNLEQLVMNAEIMFG